MRSQIFSADCTEIPQAYLMYGKGFLGNMTENLHADCVQSRQAGFMQCFSKATPHKARLTALHAICLQIFRHIAQKSLAIRQYACGISGQSAKKSDNAPYAQALCGVAFRIWGIALL